MRDIPADLDAIWRSGDYTGSQRPFARLTIQHLDMQLHTNLNYNVYASFVLPNTVAPDRPKELPNVKSVKWNRGIDVDVASCTIELYNTSPQPLGTTFVPGQDLDYPGWYTFARGLSQYSSRWGHTENEWSRLIVPDNIIRTFEGYGYDENVCPELDPNLVQTGMWIIKEVDYGANGLISITCEDMASIMKDQILYHPVVPDRFYPLKFKKGGSPGINKGYTYTYSVGTSGVTDPNFQPPADWAGPTGAPSFNSFVNGDGYVELYVNSVPSMTAGYSLVGVQVIVDNVRLRPVYQNGETVQVPLMNGNVYTVSLAAVVNRDSDGHQQVSSHAAPVEGRPGNTAQAGSVTDDSVFVDKGVGLTDVLGSVRWQYTGAPSEFVIVIYKGTDVRFATVASDASGEQAFQTGMGDLSAPEWNALVMPHKASNDTYGNGSSYVPDGEMYAPPTEGVPPHPPHPQGNQATVTTPSGTVVPLRAMDPVAMEANACSTSGAEMGPGVTVTSGTGTIPYHGPEKAYDHDVQSIFVSNGYATPSQQDAYEWIQCRVFNIEMSKVVFSTRQGRYKVYLSVFANGVWVTHDELHDRIPYRASSPQTYNGADIPFVESMIVPDHDGPHTILLRQPIPGVQKVRLTFANLQPFDRLVPTQQDRIYRMGLREWQVYAAGAVIDQAQEALPPPAYGFPQDDNSPDVIKTWTQYTPPSITPGAGFYPGTYHDYTDLVKLFSAWAGFYWPRDAKVTLSDGTILNVDFGTVTAGEGLLLNVDPVLGDESAGRVWGDFQQTGTAGVSELEEDVWDRKPILDAIAYVREIIGFLFYVDELGGVVWRSPNIFKVGNWLSTLGGGAGRVDDIVTIDEKQTLIDLNAKLSSRNVRERYFVTTKEGKKGAVSIGYNPNPTGLRRVGGWTDQRFGAAEECQMMSDMIALRALMSCRVDRIQIPGYPRVQVDDQIRIFERVTSEGYLHYVRGISSNLDMESGVWTYDIDTNWLGEDPFNLWLFHEAELPQSTQDYLTYSEIGSGLPPTPPATDNPPAYNLEPFNPPGPTHAPPVPIAPQASYTTENQVKLVKTAALSQVWLTDGVTRRGLLNTDERDELIALGLVPSAVLIISDFLIDRIKIEVGD